MTIGAPARTILNKGNLNNLADGARVAGLGDGLGLITRWFKGAVASNILVLPLDCKASRVISCFVVAGGAQTGTYLITDVPEVTPAAGHCSVNPKGDIVFAGADALTAVEVVYVVQETGGTFTDVIVGVGTVFTLLGSRGAVKLLSVVVNAGGATPGPIPNIDARGTAAPAATHCALSLDGLSVKTNAADATGTAITVTYLATPNVGNGVAADFGTRLDTVAVGTPTV